MWHLILMNIVYPVMVESAWVEIPQVPNQKPELPQFASTKPAQFVFGTPKVSFISQKTIATTPLYRTMLATPPPTTTTVPNYNYKSLLTTSTISPLTTPRISQIISNRKDEYQPKTGDITKRPRISQISNSNDGSEDVTKKSEYLSQSESKNQHQSGKNPGIMPLLQSIQETLTINAKKSLKSKILLLTKLKDNLLVNIDDRMSSMWKKSDETNEARGHDEHEMDFPSNEGALMTIGFLTFAVFLIKLVLKLIHALKDKQSATVVTTVAPAVAFIGRRKRQLEEDLKILQYIDEYKFN